MERRQQEECTDALENNADNRFFFSSFHRCGETSGSLEERECESLTSIKVRKCQIHHLVLQ